MRGIVLFFFIFILVLNKLSANIILPTDPEVVGLPATPKKKMPPGVYKSWKDQQNRSVKDGIFVVHCLENSWGMDIATQEIYNKKNPDTLIDCKPTQFGFRREHLPISPDDFIEIYPEALSQRRNISGSVLAMNREKGFSLTSTFGKCGYIFSIPPECILFTQQQDSVIRATYSEDIEKIIVKKFGTDFQENLYSLEDLSLSLKTNGGPSKRQQFLNNLLSVDGLIRYPNFTLTSDTAQAAMNEVVFASCAVAEDQTVYRPTIIGIFINNDPSPMSSTCQILYTQSHAWEESIKKYAKANNLPIYKFSSKPYSLTETDLKPLFNEVLGQYPENEERSFKDRLDEYQAQKRKFQEKFRLTSEQLKTYSIGNIIK